MNSGGLIEASPTSSQARATAQFPPVNSGGLIEAFEERRHLGRRYRAFPPVNSGGLIEASAGNLPGYLSGSFRR